MIHSTVYKNIFASSPNGFGCGALHLFQGEKTHFLGSCLFLREMRISGVSSSSIFWRHHTIFFVWFGFGRWGGDFLFPSPLGQGQYIHKHLPPSSSQVVSSKLVVFGHPSFGLFCPFWTGSKFVCCCCDRCGGFCAIRLL